MCGYHGVFTLFTTTQRRGEENCGDNAPLPVIGSELNWPDEEVICFFFGVVAIVVGSGATDVSRITRFVKRVFIGTSPTVFWRGCVQVDVANGVSRGGDGSQWRWASGGVGADAWSALGRHGRAIDVPVSRHSKRLCLARAHDVRAGSYGGFGVCDENENKSDLINKGCVRGSEYLSCVYCA